jgi:hypothetical protein
MGCIGDYDKDCKGKKPKGCMCYNCCKIPKEIREELEHYRKTRVPRCQNPKCLKNMVKIVDEKYHQTWKYNCKCNPKGLGLMVG